MGLFSELKKELSGVGKQFKEDAKKTSAEFKKDIKKSNNQFASEIQEIKDDSKRRSKDLNDHIEKTKKKLATDIEHIKSDYREKEKEQRRPKVKIEVINGDAVLGYEGYKYEMIQFNVGEVQFKVKGEIQNETFALLNFERSENIKKSALDVAGWTFAGNMFFGKAGALAGGLGAQTGKDKSTAALFLVNKGTKKKVMLIIKCDSKTLEKLSSFTLSQDEIEEKQPKTYDKYEQLEKVAKLKEQGILTDEEFKREKDKILNT
ncbi:gas vesicle protein [Cytobacillus horneckiae]|uniref:SHOCT domain-containing protein n=1 Tax=Cytobacillus horneckiae TaxID=549687 RepID=UPI0019D28F53|nr:SHOCT domain-containing protein [Cytobacillus horneckiae]MBN6886263.1 SHOCT domain-containing protein [Cytobacillus horneckiae]